jgi:hypothetical protein
VVNSLPVHGDPAVHTELTDSDTQLQSKLHSASKFVRDFLSPDPQILGICDELG